MVVCCERELYHSRRGTHLKHDTNLDFASIIVDESEVKGFTKKTSAIIQIKNSLGYEVLHPMSSVFFELFFTMTDENR